ncbi:MAG: HD-like signal output (HDOD) protein [Alphaproteobacteria bacterium]|jgi:HD-like signal output (HDOD) protein
MSMTPIIKFANNSFTLPDTCLRLRQMLDDPRSGLKEMAQVMSVDPSLSAKVLKLANSALFRFPAQVTSVSKALNVIGGEAAYNISMAETANVAFKTFNSSLLDFTRFWEKSVHTGLIAKSIAQQMKARGSERFFVMGILMNLSELVCATRMEEKYKRYMKKEPNALPIESQESLFGFTFSECSGHILEGWKLPENLYTAMLGLSFNEPKEFSKDESILYMATTMANLNKGQSLLQEPNLNLQALQSIGLNDYEYDIIHQFAQSETSKIAQVIN